MGALRQQLLGKPCQVYSSNLRVRVSATGLATYPDVTVICGPSERDPDSPTHVVNPIRDIVPRAQFRWCRVNRVDTERKVVLVTQGEGRALTEVPYDQLVFGLGKVTDFSAMAGVGAHALPMKDLGDAFSLRNHVLRCLELADIEDDPEERRALLTFVVAGGGFSGVEPYGEPGPRPLSRLRRRRTSD